MDIKEVERIKKLISNAELESAKAQGKKDSIKQQWKEKYGTDDFEEIKNKAEELADKIQSYQSRMETLYNELITSYDWDSLEEELC